MFSDEDKTLNEEANAWLSFVNPTVVSKAPMLIGRIDISVSDYKSIQERVIKLGSLK